VARRNLILIAACVMESSMAVAAPAKPAKGTEFCQVGNLVVIRVSMIAPNGSLAGFKNAVADHAKWYTDHGYSKDEIVIAQVKAPDGVAKAPDEVMTIHYRFQPVPASKQDATWKAFVAEYRANSTIVSETTACFPK
jgi:hypothetical protein